MNKQIKYRGKRVEDGKWIYGSLIHRPEGFAKNEKEYSAIVIFDKDIDSEYNAYFELEVIPRTTGQFTGLTDKNEKEIYEGDVLTGRFASGHGGKSTKYKNFNYSVQWCSVNLGWRHKINKVGIYRFLPSFQQSEIVSNIHDNPELLNK